jgi:ribonucleoside-diphosphate reductase subunit M2
MFSLESPTKPSAKPAAPLIDDERQPESPDTLADPEETSLDELRKKFVGEVDLPQSAFVLIYLFDCYLVQHR